MPEGYWTRSAARTLGRRRLLAGAATGVGALALTAAGCGDDDSKPATSAATAASSARAAVPTTVPQTPTETPRPGGTWRIVGSGPNGVQDPNFAVTTGFPMLYADRMLEMGNASRKL